LKSGAFLLGRTNCNKYDHFIFLRQHILGVMDNVIYHFVGNLTGFRAVKEF